MNATIEKLFGFDPKKQCPIITRSGPMIKTKTLMKYLMTIVLLVAMGLETVAQETHYHKGLRSQEENDRYGIVGNLNFNGGGTYWSRVRNIDDVSISANVKPKDYDVHYDQFKRLCRLAYDAFDDGDYYMTAIYGDSALTNNFFTPELLYYMGVSLEKLECYKDADIAFQKALKAGYANAAGSYAQFQQHMEQLKALDKLNKKEAKRKGTTFVPLSEGKKVPEPMEVKRAPSLQLISNSLKLEGLTADGTLLAGTKCKLLFRVRNNGNAPTGKCDIVLGEKSGNDALNIGSIPPTIIQKRHTISVEIPFEADKTLEDGELDFILLIDEPNGYGLPPRHIKVKTQKAM